MKYTITLALLSGFVSCAIAPQALAQQRNIEIVQRDNQLVLLGTKLRDQDAQPIELGRSNGIGEGFININLDSDWRLAKRTYNDKALGHVYLTTDAAVTSR